MKIKVALLSYTDSGGAGRASLKISNLSSLFLKIDLFVMNKKNLNSYKINFNFIKKIYLFFLPKLNNFLLNLQRSNLNEFHSLDFFPINNYKLINQLNYDIIQLGWINNMISIEDINRINKPIVWRFSDFWPLSGCEHYIRKEDKRWIEGYYSKNKNVYGLDLNKYCWMKKMKLKYKKNIHIVTPSKWLARCAKKSPITKNWPVSVIPTPIDLKVFKYYHNESIKIKKKLNIRDDKKILLYGAHNLKDERKGYDYLRNAINNFLDSDKFHLIIFGTKDNNFHFNINCSYSFLGYVDNDELLAKLYSSCDILVLPYTNDNLPQIGLEAQSCGLPIVSFDIDGINEITEDKKTGYLSKIISSQGLAEGITWLAKKNKNLFQKNSINRAKKKWNKEIVLKKYNNLYKQVLKST